MTDPFHDFPDSKNTETARAMLAACVQTNPECQQDVIVAALRHWLQTIALVDQARSLSDQLATHARSILSEHRGLTEALIAAAMRRN